ncbi:DEAD/DEAH box helicase [Desulfotalea psychrophila]|nr:ATP-binding domain-containing protein [Desulfotalea psychrophila]
MALDIVWGNVKNSTAAKILSETLQNLAIDGTLYLGYPIMASADNSTTVQALLLSKVPGLVAFNFPPIETCVEELQAQQDSLAYAIEGSLGRHDALREGRRLGVTANIVSFFPASNSFTNETNDKYYFAYPKNISLIFTKCAPVDESFFRSLVAAIQRVTTIKPIKKRTNVKGTDSRGAILKKLEVQIANLDQWQKKAAIETPEGAQRVRGLAGSGKTVVLALKAAYLHAEHPEWDIAITFNTRSLSQQFFDLVERFSIEHSGDKPNFEKLHILHAWGSYSASGIYSTIADSLNVPAMDFGTAKNQYGYNNAFHGACGELLTYAKSQPVELYDAVLIDEAQDLPVPFFQLVYLATKSPKRIVWAYDELQNLNNTQMTSVQHLFNGNVSINNVENSPQQDIILPICYRNTPWALTLAHALGFGIYRDDGLVQLFDELSLWQEIGYQIDSGNLNFDSDVTLSRRSDSCPRFFDDLLTKEDAVITKKFEDEIAQYEWIAEQINKNITEDELDPDDILIILPNALTAKTKYPLLAQSLQRHGIDSHLAGVSSRSDVFFIRNSVVVSSIYRAKGNEAPMVYLANSNYCAQGYELIKLRNTLFTAITRSRAWVRLCGYGRNMDILIDEIQRTVDNSYKLKFHVPTKGELAELRLINRDRTPEEKEKIRKAEESAKGILKLIEDGTLSPSNSAALQSLLESLGKNQTSTKPNQS